MGNSGHEVNGAYGKPQCSKHEVDLDALPGEFAKQKTDC